MSNIEDLVRDAWIRHSNSTADVSENSHDTDMYIFTLGYLASQEDLLAETKKENEKLKKELENV